MVGVGVGVGVRVTVAVAVDVGVVAGVHPEDAFSLEGSRGDELGREGFFEALDPVCIHFIGILLNH